MEEKFIYPTKRAKLLGAISITIAVLLIFTISPLVDLLISNIDNATNIESIKLYLILFNIVSFILFSIVTIWWLLVGTRTFKNKHFPPKGFPIVIRTKVQTGTSAIMSAVWCYLSSLLIMPFVALFAYLAWLSYGI